MKAKWKKNYIELPQNWIAATGAALIVSRKTPLYQPKIVLGYKRPSCKQIFHVIVGIIIGFSTKPPIRPAIEDSRTVKRSISFIRS